MFVVVCWFFWWCGGDVCFNSVLYGVGNGVGWLCWGCIIVFVCVDGCGLLYFVMVGCWFVFVVWICVMCVGVGVGLLVVVLLDWMWVGYYVCVVMVVGYGVRLCVVGWCGWL